MPCMLITASGCQTPVCSLFRFFALHLTPAASALLLLRFGTLSLQLFKCVPDPTLFVIIARLTISSRPSNLLKAFLLAPEIRLLMTTLHINNIYSCTFYSSHILSNRGPTGALAHAVDLHHRNVQTVEKLERLLHHRRRGRHEQLAAVEAESVTDGTEHQPVCQRPAVRHVASEHTHTRSLKFILQWFETLRYGDGAGNTAEENSSIFSLIRMH